jgi:Protein of unknown function (DUF4012)
VARRRFVARAVAVALAVFAVGSTALGVVAYSSARSVEGRIVAEFSAGQADLESGKALLQKATKDQNPAELEQARSDFKSARAHFGGAPQMLSRNLATGVASYLPVPYVAPRVKAVQSLSIMGTSLADAALVGVDIDAALVNRTHGSGSGFLDVLNTMSPKIPTVRADLTTARQAAGAVDASVLPASQAAALTKAISSIDKALKSLDELSSLLPVAGDILGANGPRNYLVEQVAPAELRAGGGFIGSFSVVTADAGKIKLGHTGNIGAVEYPRPNSGSPGYVAPPGPLQSFIGRSSFGIADSNFFPDFKTSAYWAEYFTPKEIGVKPDGVISIDPDVVAAMLNITGPIKVPGYDITIDAKTFTNWLFEQQYAIQNISGTKKYVFSTIASILIPKLTSLPPSRWPDLITLLNGMASSRHFQVYFNNQAAEATMERYGWSGTFNPRKAGDVMYEVESNFGATKANHFVTRTYSVQLSRSGAKLHHVITIDLTNNTPPGYEGGILYDCYLRLYVPADATNLKTLLPLAQKGIPDDTVPTGYQIFQGWLEINPNRYTERKLSFSYDTPWSGGSGDHVIYWQKQPGTGSDRITVNWRPAAGLSYTVTGTLATDKQISLGSHSVSLAPGLAGAAQMPQLSL